MEGHCVCHGGCTTGAGRWCSCVVHPHDGEWQDSWGGVRSGKWKGIVYIFFLAPHPHSLCWCKCSARQLLAARAACCIMDAVCGPGCWCCCCVVHQYCVAGLWGALDEACERVPPVPQQPALLAAVLRSLSSSHPPCSLHCSGLAFHSFLRPALLPTLPHFLPTCRSLQGSW